MPRALEAAAIDGRFTRPMAKSATRAARIAGTTDERTVLS